MVKIQTYEPQDMIVKKDFQLKKGLWKGEFDRPEKWRRKYK